MTIEKNIRARQTGIVIQNLNGETLIYDLQANKAFCLNETTAHVYQMCDGAQTITQMSAKLSKTYNQPISEDFVWLAIEELKRNNLLENAEQLATRFTGVSRREAIRKVGFASLVALPVVAALIAPTAAAAASPSVCPACTVSLPLGSICNVGGAGCVASNKIGYNSTACPNAQCTTCACTIPNGGNSCNSTCSV